MDKWDIIGRNPHSQLGVLVSPVSLKVLSDRDSLLDEAVEVLGEGGGEAWRGGQRHVQPTTAIPSIPATENQIVPSQLSVPPSSCQDRFCDSPLVFRILRILFPVTNLTWGTPWLSRRMTPI